MPKKLTEYKCKAINISDDYNRGLLNAKNLKHETNGSRSKRDIIEKIRPWFDLFTFFLLLIAFYFAMRHKNNTEKLLAEIKNEHKELENSIKKLDDLLIKNTGEAWKSKGHTIDGQGKYDEAIQAYDKAIEINPQDADAWNSKGIVLKLFGRTTEADSAFAKAKELGYMG